MFIVRVTTEDDHYARVDREFETYEEAQAELDEILDWPTTYLDDSPIVFGEIEEI